MKYVNYRVIPFDAPIFYNQKFNLKLDKKNIFMNERIIEIPFVFQNLILKKGSKMLEFGCCQSTLAMQLASLGYQVTGVDFNDYEFEHPNLKVFKGDFLSMDFEEESFDAITAISAVEHSGLGRYSNDVYSEGDLKVMEKFYRLLKNGNGILILTIPFGREFTTVKNKLRIYDLEHVNKLCSKFTVLKKEFYCRLTRMQQWAGCTEGEAVDIDTKEPISCIICLVLRKDNNF